MSAQPNRSQAELWNEASGATWVQMQPVLDRMLAPFTDLIVEAGFPGVAGRVLDVGCGAGATTLAMAQRLGPGGACLGVDISAPLVAAAQARAAGVASADFVQADAQTYAFEPESFDAIISRFGVMFFDDPPAAFANLRRAARPGAKLACMAWRSATENPFFSLAGRVAAPFVALPTPDPDAPGQFAFADRTRVRDIVQAGGWRDIDVSAADVPAEVAEADLMAYATRMGPLGHAFGSLPARQQAELTEALRGAYAPFVHAGAARFTAACWLVTARR